MVQIKGQYTQADFQKAQMLHSRQGSATPATRIFLIAVAALFYISLIVLVLLGRLHWLYLLAPLALLFVFLLFQYLYRPYALGRTFRKHKDLADPFEMELSDQGLAVSNPHGNAQIPWNSFVKWVESREIILLYRTFIIFQMVPKRLFSTPSDLQYLREQLALNKVPEAGKTDQSISFSRWLLYIILIIALAAMLYMNLRTLPR